MHGCKVELCTVQNQTRMMILKSTVEVRIQMCGSMGYDQEQMLNVMHACMHACTGCSRETALQGQDLPRMYLAHHELQSVLTTVGIHACIHPGLQRHCRGRAWAVIHAFNTPVQDWQALSHGIFTPHDYVTGTFHACL